MHDVEAVQQKDGYQIIEGDCLDVLRRMPDESVQCCVTSPPYFGLRDYGTATWDISNAEDAEIAEKCDHQARRPETVAKSKASSTLGGSTETVHFSHNYSTTCGKCGAVRVDAQIGLEATPAEFVAKMVEVFEEVRRVLKRDGTLWLNLGDSYAGSGRGLNADGTHSAETHPAKQSTNRGSLDVGRVVNEKSFSKNLIEKGAIGNAWVKPPVGLKQKDLIGIPWRVAFALQEAGWWLRQDIIWSKPNPMPESVTDRCTKSHEYIFLLAKSAKYFFDAEAIKEECSPPSGGRQKAAMRSDDRYVGSDFKDYHEGRTGRHQEYQPETRNKRSVWHVNPQPFKGWIETSRLERVQEDAVSDGMTNIVFPDCPTCEDRFARLATPLCDEREVDVLSRIERIGSHLAQEQASDFVPTVQSLVSDSWQHNSGYLRLRNLLSANGHSTQNHKTARDLLTSLSCSSFVQILDRIPDTLDGFFLSVMLLSTHGNKISLDGMDAHLLAKIPHYRTDKISCSYCQLYHVKSRKTDHFATFPPKLIEPCILAGTSEKGACADCGAAYERVLEKETNTALRNLAGKNDEQYQRSRVTPRGSEHGDFHDLGTVSVKHLGWRKTCKCETAEIVPCVVLDPFCGSGTTGLVSLRHRRNFTGIELNPEYIKIAEKRLNGVQVKLF